MLCSSSCRTRKSSFRNKDLKKWWRWLCPNLCNSMHQHKMPEDCVLHRPSPAKLWSQRWSSALLMILSTLGKRTDAATVSRCECRWHCFKCLVSAVQGNCWKFPDDCRKQFTYPWEKGVLNLNPVFTAWLGKKTHPHSTPYFNGLIQCCDQNTSIHKVSG